MLPIIVIIVLVFIVYLIYRKLGNQEEFDLDYELCNTWRTEYDIRDGQTWGTAPHEIQQQYIKKCAQIDRFKF